MGFELSSHEVMRGIKVRDGRLVLKPWALFYVGSFVDVAAAVGLMAWALLAGGLWVLAVPWTAWAGIDSVGRCRLAVIASPDELIIRNRFRTFQARLDDVGELGTEEVEWFLRQPVLVGLRNWGWPTDWQIGWVDAGGRRIRCDALVSSPPSEFVEQLDPTPTEMKIATLRRWISEHRDLAA